jgi:hypothetical protein
MMIIVHVDFVRDVTSGGVSHMVILLTPDLNGGAKKDRLKNRENKEKKKEGPLLIHFLVVSVINILDIT